MKESLGFIEPNQSTRINISLVISGSLNNNLQDITNDKYSIRTSFWDEKMNRESIADVMRAKEKAKQTTDFKFYVELMGEKVEEPIQEETPSQAQTNDVFNSSNRNS